MTRFIADFILDSDIRLPDHLDALTWPETDNGFELIIRNVKTGFSYINDALSAHLLFDADDLKQAREKSQDLLAAALNSLVWVSLSMIRQAKLIRIVDWSPGLVTRDSLFFTRAPKIATTLPMLEPELVESAAAVFRSQQSDATKSALRWFRLAIGADGLEEQFTYFWFSLETAAEFLKTSGKVPSKCPACENDLYCTTCQAHPLHRKFSADAIKELILSSFSDEETGKTAFRTLTRIRHTLMHGRRVSSIEERLPYGSKIATNQLAQVSRNAILKMSDFSSYAPSLAVSIVENEDVLRGNVILSAHVKTAFGDPNNPQLSANTGIEISARYPGQPE